MKVPSTDDDVVHTSADTDPAVSRPGAGYAQTVAPSVNGQSDVEDGEDGSLDDVAVWMKMVPLTSATLVSRMESVTVSKLPC